MVVEVTMAVEIIKKGWLQGCWMVENNFATGGAKRLDRLNKQRLSDISELRRLRGVNTIESYPHQLNNAPRSSRRRL